VGPPSVRASPKPTHGAVQKQFYWKPKDRLPKLVNWGREMSSFVH